MTWIKDDASKLTMPDQANVILAIVQDGIKTNAQNTITTGKSKYVFFTIIERLFTDETKFDRIGKGTIIEGNVSLGKNVVIGANCVLQGNIKIDDDTTIEHNVVIINNVTIGKSCYIQSGVYIGHDGFSYTIDENNRKTMVKHFGGVRIGDNVFIGPDVNIARGTIDETVIGNGVKIAPSTHIGHNNVIEDDAVIICSLLYGSVKTGKNAYISASAIRNQCVIGDNSIVGMGSVVTKNVDPNITVVGSPAKPFVKKEQ